MRASFHMYGYDYSSGTISVAFNDVMGAYGIATPSTDSMTVGGQTLNNSKMSCF